MHIARCTHKHLTQSSNTSLLCWCQVYCQSSSTNTRAPKVTHETTVYISSAAAHHPSKQCKTPGALTSIWRHLAINPGCVNVSCISLSSGTHRRAPTVTHETAVYTNSCMFWCACSAAYGLARPFQWVDPHVDYHSFETALIQLPHAAPPTP